MFAYHFHAKTRYQRGNQAQEAHGVMTSTEHIDHQDKYGAVVLDIAKFMDLAPDDIVVTSLTFLHEVP